jgi:photosystem II stability/assembly factor-like uncharacterized protein
VLQGDFQTLLAVPKGAPYPGAFSVVGATTVFAAGYCGPCGTGTISVEVTHDGGATWDKAIEVTNNAVGPGSSMQFVDAQHGWIALSNGIFATTDGGQTWTRQLP